MGYPSEAVKIDTLYIEDIISGYKTVKTSGREMLPRELETFTTGVAHGSKLKRSRYPARTITVEFLLKADTMTSLREKFVRLANLLDREDATFIFKDEPDKFYVGTPILGDIKEQGYCSAVGTYIINCLDPFKYSVREYVKTQSTQDPTLILVDYNGTQEAHPILEVEFPQIKDTKGEYTDQGDCGYVAFIDEYENIIQMGNPDEVNNVEIEASQTLINRSFSSTQGWTINSGHIFGGGVVQGSIAVDNITDTIWGKTWSAAHPTAYGSTAGNWHGPTMYVAPADEYGNRAKNFDLSWQHKFCISDNSQMGCFQALAMNGESVVAGVRIAKTVAGGYGTVDYIVDNQIVGSVQIDLSYYNTHFGYRRKDTLYKTVTQKQYYNKKTKKWQTKKIKGAKTRKVSVTQVSGYSYTTPNLNAKISKIEGKVTFKIGDLEEVTYPSTTETEVNGLVFFTGQYGTNAAITTNSILSAKMVKLNADTRVNIRNTFSAGDVVIADCNSAEIYLKHVDPASVDPQIETGDVIPEDPAEQGQRMPMLGALGNDWENFTLTAGTNQIKIDYSPWVAQGFEPVFRVRYREVYV